MKQINIQAIKHIPKSNMAYALNEDHLVLLLQTAHNDFKKIAVLIGDPCLYTHIETKDGDGWLWEGRLNEPYPMLKKWETTLFDYYYLNFETKTTRCKYAFLLYTKNEVYVYNTRGVSYLNTREAFKINRDINKDYHWDSNEPLFILFNYFNYPYINKEDIFTTPKWSQNVTWYQIFMDRFNRKINDSNIQIKYKWNEIQKGISNNMLFGGNIDGVIEKIPYIKSLGITGIYFTPIFLAPTAHKYDTTNYLLIDPQFGTNDDFKHLVDVCHENGIRIILDAVFNHCGYDHPFFQDVIKNKSTSIYYDCFFIEDENFINFELDDTLHPVRGSFDHPLKYRTFATTPYMPKLNTKNPIMEKYLLDVTTYWTKMGIDGWRLDVSNEVAHAFWRKFRILVKSLNPDAYIVGENWDDSNSWLVGDQMDAVMNHELSYPIWQYFGTDFLDTHIDSTEFRDQINYLQIRYSENVSKAMFNLLGSHDTKRILTKCNNNKNLVKLAYIFMFSYTGSPNIYYGDEIGLVGGKDPDNRRCMIWDESQWDLDMLDFIKTLIRLRNENSAFKSYYLNFIHWQNDLLCYQKDNLIFILNKKDTSDTLVLTDTMKSLTYIDIFLNEKITLNNELVINPYEFKILKKIV